MAFRGSQALAIGTAVLCGALFLRGQPAPVPSLGIGKVLVVPRDSPDPVFAQTVILLVSYDHDGTVGLVLNRRTKVPISRALKEMKGAGAHADPVYAGGPVDTQNVLALLKASSMPEGAAHVAGKVYLVRVKPLLEKTLAGRPGPGAFRVYLGYCGWGPGQLESEVARGFWHVLAGSEDLAFDTEPESLWSRLIARTQQQLALLNKASAAW